MISTRATVLRSETQALRHQWLQSGQCARCFHASTRNREGVPIRKIQAKAPSNSSPMPSRKERSSLVSREVSKIQRGPSSPGANTTSPRPQFSLRRGGAAGGAAQRGARPARNEGRSPNNKRFDEERGSRKSSAASSNVTRLRSHDFNPPTLTKDGLLNNGKGSATIANSNFEGIIEDKLRPVTDPGRLSASYEQTAAKLAQGQLVRFENEQQVERVGEVLREKILANDDRLEEKLLKLKFERIPAEAEKAFSERMIKGIYDTEGLLEGKKYQQPVLNDIARQLLMNGTFLAKDRSQLLEKVQSLLPAAASTGAAKRSPPKQKAA